MLMSSITVRCLRPWREITWDTGAITGDIVGLMTGTVVRTPLGDSSHESPRPFSIPVSMSRLHNDRTTPNALYAVHIK